MTTPRHHLPLRASSVERPRGSPSRGKKPAPVEKSVTEAIAAEEEDGKTFISDRQRYKSQNLRIIASLQGNAEAFIEELETKRRQLDEQIQRYIKQKDREFKVFERDLRSRYREETKQNDAEAEPYDANEAEVVSRTIVGPVARSIPSRARAQAKRADSGLRDTAVSKERDSDLLGVFTPSFLPLLNRNLISAQAGPAAHTAELVPGSAPAAAPLLPPLRSLGEPPLLRSNSDPSDEKPGSKPMRAKLEQRTSSSGSESRSLISALKSPLGNGSVRTPKRKRVSIVVGDEVVAPSDSVPVDGDDEMLNSVERIDFGASAGGSREDDDEHDDERANGAESPEKSTRDSGTGDEEADGEVATADATSRSPVIREPSPVFRTSFTTPRASSIASALALQRGNANALGEQSPAAMLSPKGAELKVFDFSDTELDGNEAAEPPASDPEDAVDVSPVQSLETPETSRLVNADANISVPVKPIPTLRTSSSSSSQPVSPGFSKPSVQADPILALDDAVETPEIEQNDDLGSVKAFLNSAGSLGESFMERNAEELTRTGRRRTSAAS